MFEPRSSCRARSEAEHIYTGCVLSQLSGAFASTLPTRAAADRRVVIPQALGYDTALTLKPTPGNFQELRSLESIVKNPNRDASLLFDVTLERIKGKR